MARATPEEIKGLKHAKSLFNHFKMSINRLKAWSNRPTDRDKIQRLLSIMVISLHHFDNVHLKKSGLTIFNTLSGKTYARILISLYIEGKQAKTANLNNFNFNSRTYEKYLKELATNLYIQPVKINRLHHINGKSYFFCQQEIELTAKGYDLVHFIFQILIPDELLEL
jgi:hypothetical protein